jgi:hypothetical protein
MRRRHERTKDMNLSKLKVFGAGFDRLWIGSSRPGFDEEESLVVAVATQISDRVRDDALRFARSRPARHVRYDAFL